MTTDNSIGCIHGRFQPFHLEHVEYALEAAKRCRKLFVGITQFDIRTLNSSGGSHRSEESSNPFTYRERCELIGACLVAEKIKLNRFEFVPFPIERHASIPDFVDAKATFYTTVCEPWNTEKIKKLNDLGLKVEVLWERQTKKFSGQEVRQSLIEGNENWKSMVHKAAIPLIENWGIGERLRILATPDTQLLPTDVSNGMELLSSG